MSYPETMQVIGVCLIVFAVVLKILWFVMRDELREHFSEDKKR